MDADYEEGRRNELDDVIEWIERAYGDYAWHKAMVRSLRNGEHYLLPETR